MDKVIRDAITSIATTSEALEKYCNDPKNFNSYGSNYLEQLSWELHKQANELKEFEYRYGF
jgi:uncharacterized protein YeaO (DUF488 family)